MWFHRRKNQIKKRQTHHCIYHSSKLNITPIIPAMTTNIAVLDYETDSELEYTWYILNRSTQSIVAAICDSDCQTGYDRLSLLAIELCIDLFGTDFN